MPPRLQEEGMPVLPVLSKLHRPRKLQLVAADELSTLCSEPEFARRIQSRLFPDFIPTVPGYDIDVFCRPEGKFSGDFHDFIKIDSDHLGLVVGDALGKGIVPSLLMTEARAAIRAMASVKSSPRDILIGVNRVLLQNLEKGAFMTVFMAVLDLPRRVMTMASAGHMPLLLWNLATGKCAHLQAPGVILGAVREENFEEMVQERSVTLDPGDRFLLYTDGVFDSQSSDDLLSVRRRLVASTGAHAGLPSGEFLRQLVSSLEEEREGRRSSDDITLVTGLVVDGKQF